MRIYLSRKWPIEIPPAVSYPCLILWHDAWNDFGYRTLFKITGFRSREYKFLISTVKIVKRNPDEPKVAILKTPLPSDTEALSDDYCSLGQDVDYYGQLSRAGRQLAKETVVALRDMAYSAEIRNEFEMMTAVTQSLIRFSDANKALHEGSKLLQGLVVKKEFEFQFSCSMQNADAPHIVDFTFEAGQAGLLRTIVLIGRNGTGKTEYLAQMALCLSGLASEKSQKRRQYEFTPSRPPFSRVIAVSYSVFDVFQRPTQKDKRFSYRYCGLRKDASDSDGLASRSASSSPLLTQTQLLGRLKKSITTIEQIDRLGEWKKAIVDLLQDDVADIKSEPLHHLAFYDRLSSGQRVLVCIITEIVANIAPDALLLFDEPEIHLHPDLFSALVRTLRNLLESFSAYSIIATHSPLLLQETPGRQVRVFRRIGNTPYIVPLSRESFGENLTSITQDVFESPHSTENFPSVLRRLLELNGTPAPEAVFPMRLPLQTAAHVLALKEGSP